jgi:hypothetical protein
MSISRGPPNVLVRTAPFGPSAGRTWPGLDAQSSLLRPDSPSNESSASTDDDYTAANANPHALEYYLGSDDTWREAEILSHSSEESGLSDGGDEMTSRHFNGEDPGEELLTTG